jgi:hypothetical protein
MIPEAQFLNVLLLQKRAAFLVMLHLFRQTVLKTIQLHIQPGVGAIEIQDVNSLRMLPAKFETGESMTPQRAPEFFFVVRLVGTKLAGGLDRVHAERMRVARKNSSPARTVSLSSPKGGVGEEREKKRGFANVRHHHVPARDQISLSPLKRGGRISARHIQPEQAVAEVHNAFAGRGQVLRRNLVEPSASLHHRASLAQHGKVFGRHVRAASGNLGQLPHHARFAKAQFLEYLPPRRMAQGVRQPVKVGQRLNWHLFLLVFLCIHGKYKGFMAIIAFSAETFLL